MSYKGTGIWIEKKEMETNGQKNGYSNGIMIIKYKKNERSSHSVHSFSHSKKLTRCFGSKASYHL